MGNLKIGAIPKKGPNGLTQLQQRFCEEYVKDFNGTQAYLRANPTCTYRTAGENSHQLLKKEEIKREIAKIQKDIYDSQFVNYERIAAELAEIGFHSDSEKNRLQALAQLSKILGLEKTVVSADVNQTIDIKVGIDDND
jgi:phage terminase small subunit